METMAKHNLEVRLAVVEEKVERLEKMDELVRKLENLVSSISTQMKITWALMFAIVVALIGVAVSNFQVGGMP